MIENGLAEKIKKLLAMAEHPNSNEHEAATALEMAQKLLLEHNLTMESVRGEAAREATGIGMVEKYEPDGYVWRWHLVNVIALNNMCRVVGSHDNNKWTLFGTRSNVRSVLEMYSWVNLQLVFMAASKYKEYKADGGDERPPKWKLGFFTGAISAISERLRKPMEEFTARADCKAIVIRNEEAIKGAVRKVFPFISSGHGLSSSSDGVVYGRQAGNNVEFAPKKQVSSGKLLLH